MIERLALWSAALSLITSDSSSVHNAASQPSQVAFGAAEAAGRAGPLRPAVFEEENGKFHVREGGGLPGCFPPVGENRVKQPRAGR